MKENLSCKNTLGLAQYTILVNKNNNNTENALSIC